MSQVNYILYYESFHSKEVIRKTFNHQFQDSLIYEIRETERLLSGLVSSYFHFVIFALDKYEEASAEFIRQLIPHKNNMPFIIVANEYDMNAPLIKNDTINHTQIYYLKTSELKDLPGISLRILKEQGYFKRSHDRKQSKLKMDVGFDQTQKAQIQMNNISTSGLQFQSRIQFSEKECPYIFHKTLKGDHMSIPIEIVWKKQATDGRWIYGAKYLNNIA